MSNYYFTVYLGKFLNVGMFQKGYYAISFRCYRKDEATLRIPATSDTGNFNAVPFVCREGHYVCNWKCYQPLLNETRYVTKPFFIEYQEEVVDIDLAESFRVAVDAESDSIWLDFELFYNENCQELTSLLENSRCQRIFLGCRIRQQFAPAEYIPVVFKDIFYSSLDVVISGVGCFVSNPLPSLPAAIHQDHLCDPNTLNAIAILNEISELDSICDEYFTKLEQILKKCTSFPESPLESQRFRSKETIFLIEALKVLKPSPWASLSVTEVNVLLASLFMMYSKVTFFEKQLKLDQRRLSFQSTIIRADLDNVFTDKEKDRVDQEKSILTVFKETEVTARVESVKGSTKNDYVDVENVISKILSHSCNGVHVLVFVHGFNGNRNDLKLYANQVTHMSYDLKLNTQLVFLHSSSTENKSNKSIATLGKLLAGEVKEFIAGSSFPITEISFVCHSMGGLVARCALKDLDKYKSLFSSFTTFGTPHLSTYFHLNAIISPIIGVYQYATDSISLLQLKMTDHVDKRQTLLYHLSQDNRLSNFKMVTVFASRQDRYVPFDGALILPLTKPAEAVHLPPEDRIIYGEMQRALSSSCAVLNRYQVFFEQTDSVIHMDLLGRQAHIDLLRNRQLIRQAIILNNIHTFA